MQLNNITDFQEIINLGRLSTLKKLNLADNAIRLVEFPDCDPNEKLTIFKNLVEINLKDNSIEDDVSFCLLFDLLIVQTLTYKYI